MAMPLAKISVPSHLSEQKVQALADAVQEGLVATCGFPANDRFQLISRFEPASMILDPQYPNVHRTVEASVIEITMIRGITATQKSNLYRRIVSLAEASGFVGDDIMIAIIENDRGDWSAGRGQSYANIV